MVTGSSYRIWQDATTVKIYESINNTAYQRASFTASNTTGQTHTYQAAYDRTSGKIEVWRDGTYLGSWTDTTPLTSGAYLSLRTSSTQAKFDNVAVESQTKYYYFAGKRVAMRDSTGLSYIHGDHLGSATNTTGASVNTQRYYPFGTKRGTGQVTTPYRFTGQREENTIGLYFYNARWYDAALGRFAQADTVVPSPGNPQSLNRYSYTLNNPVKYTDPSGHAYDPHEGGGFREREQPTSPWAEAVDRLASLLGIGVGDLTRIADIDYATEQWVAKIDLSYEATLVGSAPESTLTFANTYQKIGPWKQTSEGELRVHALPIEAHMDNVHVSGVFEFGISEHSSLSSVKFSVGAEITHEMYGSKVNPGLEQVLTVSGEIRPNRAVLVGALVVSAVILWEAPWSAPGVIEGWRRATQGGW